MNAKRGEGRFDLKSLFRDLDDVRQAKGLTWKALTEQINAPFSETTSLPISQSTIRGIATKSSMTSAVVLQILRWLDRTPESFLPAGAVRFGDDERLPVVGATRILRLDTRKLFAALSAVRASREMSWAQAANAMPSITQGQLQSLTKGPLIGFPRVMTMTQWAQQPLAQFVRGTKI